LKTWIVVVAAAVLSVAASADSGNERPREAAETFGRALTGSRASLLRTILPQQGKVRLSLVRLGPEHGTYASGQVEAIFRDFLAAGAIRSFDVVRLESDGQVSSLVHAKAALVDREGRATRIALHLAFQPEGGRWVLREVKEAPE